MNILKKPKNETTSLILVSCIIFVVFYISYFLSGKIHHQLEVKGYTGCQSNQRQISLALRNYANDNNGCYPVSLINLAPKYIAKIPACPSPANKNRKLAYMYEVSSDFSNFTITCSGNNHYYLISKNNYPIFTSGKGAIIR